MFTSILRNFNMNWNYTQRKIWKCKVFESDLLCWCIMYTVHTHTIVHTLYADHCSFSIYQTYNLNLCIFLCFFRIFFPQKQNLSTRDRITYALFFFFYSNILFRLLRLWIEYFIGNIYIATICLGWINSTKQKTLCECVCVCMCGIGSIYNFNSIPIKIVWLKFV